MSSKRRLRRRACEGKARHASAEDAMRQLKKSASHSLTVYRCQHCGAYHVGHRKGSGLRPF